MKTSLAALAVLVLASPCVQAADQPLTLWRVEGAHNHVYLLGSLHLLRETDHPLPRAIEDAYADAEALVMELDLDDLDPVAMQAQMNQLGVLHDGRTLQDLLGDGAWAEAAAAADALQIPLDLLSGTEPWLAAVTVEQLVLLRLGFNPMYGVEMFFTAQAGRDEKPITGLETADQQLAILDSLSPEAQQALLLQTLAESQDVSAQMDRLIRAWRDGDTDYLETFLLNDMKANDELYANIVANRNRSWLEPILALLDDEDDYLVIVGALHLIGEDGLPSLLQQQGITVRQMYDTD